MGGARQWGMGTVIATVVTAVGAAQAFDPCTSSLYKAADAYTACEHKALTKKLETFPFDFATAASRCRTKYAATWDRLHAKLSATDSVCAGPRFADRGDGTVVDNLTGLQWEKKTAADGVANLSDPHDADNTYTWSVADVESDGTAYTDFLAALDGGCFAGQCDWRLPTVIELQTILAEPYPCAAHPCIDPVFGPTNVRDHWTSTLFGDRLVGLGWFVTFFQGAMGGQGQTAARYVRAVRGGR
jgi:hypothetical protein